MKKLSLPDIFFFTCILIFLSCGDSDTESIKKDLEVNSLFSDHMVLQQQDQVAFWGIATANEKIKIIGSWGNESSVSADENGEWNLNLSTPKAGGPFEVTISSSDTSIILKDVLIGEVWLASGQSNMEMPLEGFLPKEPIDNYKEEVAAADYPQIRYFDVARAMAPSPENSFVGKWNVTSPETANQFSAAGYFFARKLHQELGVPVGVITSNWGGTPVESWMSNKKITELGEFEEELKTLGAEKTKSFKDWYAKFPSVPIPEDWDNLNLEDGDYANVNFDDSSWATTDLTQGVEDFKSTSNDGAFWFRKKVMIDDIASDYTLLIPGGIDDMDTGFVNGKEIGNTIGWNIPRSYNIPKSLLVEGENVFAVRVIDTGGHGGFMGDVDLMNSNSGAKTSLIKEWKYIQIAGVQSSNFLLFHKNQEALKNPPIGIETFKLDASTPSVLYNGMIHPLIPYNIKGAIWYQGESNVGRDKQYLKLFPGMIEDWRERWNSDFSFYFVQIAPFSYGNELSPALRDAQRKSLKTPNTGMAIAMDIGLEKSIHPDNKQDVGDRLARLALANDYGKDVVASGPLYKTHSASGNKIIVEFDFAEDGLVSKASELSEFEIAANDKKFIPAKAKIINNKIEVSSSKIKEPEHVRYAWKDFVVGPLFNKEGLPASSFTTEE